MAKRRPNRTGNIYQRKDGRFEGRVHIGTDPKTGRNKRKSFYGKSEQEVKQQLRQYLAKVELGMCVEPDRITVGEWLDTWLEQYVKPTVRITTYENYEMFIRVHIKPFLGHVTLQKLRPNQLQRLYNEKQENGRVDGKGGLSARSIRIMHTIIHSSLEQAIKEELVTRNVSKSTTLPKQEKKEIRVLTLEEQKRFMDLLEGDRLGVAFLMLLGTGLRRGELLGLRWQDVNLKNGIIHVQRQLVQAKVDGKYQLIFQPPKTNQGRRTIPLPTWCLSSLKAHRAKQNEEKLSCGSWYQDNDLVFATWDGKPLQPGNFERRFKKLIKQAQLPETNLHALRHTFATRLLEQNEHPKVVQDLLGHSQISLTLDTYSHVLPDQKQQAIAKLNFLAETK